MALLGARDVIQYDRQDGHHFGFWIPLKVQIYRQNVEIANIFC